MFCVLFVLFLLLFLSYTYYINFVSHPFDEKWKKPTQNQKNYLGLNRFDYPLLHLVLNLKEL